MYLATLRWQQHASRHHASRIAKDDRDVLLLSICPVTPMSVKVEQERSAMMRMSPGPGAMLFAGDRTHGFLSCEAGRAAALFDGNAWALRPYLYGSQLSGGLTSPEDSSSRVRSIAALITT